MPIYRDACNPSGITQICGRATAVITTGTSQNAKIALTTAEGLSGPWCAEYFLGETESDIAVCDSQNFQCAD